MSYSPDLQQQVMAIKELPEHLRFMEQEGLQKLSEKGPYWLRSEISLVDLTYHPWFEQWRVLEYFRGFKFPMGLDRLQQWWEAVSSRESVRSVAQPPEFYVEQYDQLAQARKVWSRKY